MLETIQVDVVLELSVNFKVSGAVVLDAFRTKRLGSAEGQWISIC